MSRTRKFDSGWHRRDTKFHYRQKKISGVRNKEMNGFDHWDAPRLSRQASEASRVARRLYDKGWDVERIIRKLRERYNISQQEARELLPWEMTRNKGDWTDKPI